MGVPPGPQLSFIFMGFSSKNPPFLGTAIYGNLQMWYLLYQNLPQPHGTPLTPNINNLTPFANPHATPMVKANKFLSSD